MDKLFLTFCEGAAFAGILSFIVVLFEVSSPPEQQIVVFLWAILFMLSGGPVFVVLKDGSNLKDILSKSSGEVKDSPEELVDRSDKSGSLS